MELKGAEPVRNTHENLNLKFVKTRTYTIREASRQVNVSTHTLRYWEKVLEGIVVPLRTGGGQRRYTREDLRLLDTVKHLKRRGLTLAAIRDALSQDTTSVQDVSDAHLLDRLADHIAEGVRTSIYRFFRREDGSGS